jgi:hypothetical protein
MVDQAYRSQTVSIASSQMTSTTFQVADAILGGQVIFPAEMTALTAGFIASTGRISTNFYEVCGSDGEADTLTISTSKSVQLPTSVLCHHTVKLVTVRAEGGPRTLVVSRK